MAENGKIRLLVKTSHFQFFTYSERTNSLKHPGENFNKLSYKLWL